MNINELSEYLKGLPEEIISGAAEIVAETATEEFKQSFKRKSFDGNPWKEAKNPRANGSLLIDSGALVNSVRPAVVSPERVVISAGNEKVAYAQVHNEGFNGTVNIPAHKRSTKRGDQQVKAHTRKVSLPQRQFMGDSAEINKAIHKRIDGYVEAVINSKK